MSEIDITMNLWIAVTKDGDVLCYGNSNPNLDYHIADFRLDYGRSIVNGTRRWEIMGHIKKWNKQFGNEVFKCKAVKVAITIKEIKKGESDD